jgi:sarcosine oxidase, subunit gamma
MAEPLVPVEVAQVDVRADDASSLPFDAPAPNTVAAWGDRDVLWLGPDEWLVVGPAGAEGAIVDELRGALDGRHGSVVDVSAARAVLELPGGPQALATGCGLDLDPSRWMPGSCAQTLYGKAQVIVHRRDERITRLFIRPSFVGYVTARLAAAAG